jgi:hypothetical protein
VKPAPLGGRAGLPRHTNVHEGSPAPFHGGGLQGPFPWGITAPGFSQGFRSRPSPGRLQSPFPRGSTAPGFRQGCVPARHPGMGFARRFTLCSLPLASARGAFPPVTPGGFQSPFLRENTAYCFRDQIVARLPQGERRRGASAVCARSAPGIRGRSGLQTRPSTRLANEGARTRARVR